MTGRGRKTSSSLMSNMGAHGAFQIVNLLIQLVSVPILAGAWGLETYGVWLILITLPYYLIVSDFGLTAAAANDMTAAVAQDRRDDAVRTFHTMFTAMAVIFSAIFVLIFALALGPLHDLLDFAQAPSGGKAVTTLMLLIAYGLFGLLMHGVHAGLRAAGAYAQCHYILTGAYAVEAALLLGGVLVGASILDAASIYFAGHAAGVLAMLIALQRHAPWMLAPPWRPLWGELRRLARPAMAGFCIPISFALSLQGPTLVLGAIAGPSAVPFFTSVRTLTRGVSQIVLIFSQAASPHFTVANARGNEARRAELTALTLMTSLCLLVPGALALILFGTWLVALWTGGIIVPSVALVAALAVAMVLNGIWYPISNLMLAINEHGRFAYAFLALSIASVGATALLAGPLGALGAGLATVALHLPMLFWVLVQARRLGLVDAESLRSAPKIATQAVTRYLANRSIGRSSGQK